MNILEETNTRLQEKMLKLKEKQSQSRQSTESRSTMNHLSQQDIELQASIENHT